MPQRRPIRQVRCLLPVGAAAALLALACSPRAVLADGPWTITATVAAIAQSAVVPAGKSPTATVAQGAITIVWGPSTFATGKEVSGYIVNRLTVGSAPTTQVCRVAAPMRTCQDSPPAQQQVMYSIVPTQAGWTGPPSAPSAPVMLPASSPAAAPVLATVTASSTPSPTPTPSGSPTPSASPQPSPTATASASPGASPTPAAIPTPMPSPS